MEPVSTPALLRQVGKTPRQTQPATRPGRGVGQPPPSRAEVKERVDQYLYSSVGIHGMFYLLLKKTVIIIFYQNECGDNT